MDKSHRRQILRAIPNGLFVAAVSGAAGPVTAVISFVTQTSIDPPLITMAIKTGSRLYAALAAERKCALHLAGDGQAALVRQFFKEQTPVGAFIAGRKFNLSNNGTPLIDGFPMIIELELEQLFEVGDHHLFVCRPLNFHLIDDVPNLTIQQTKWHYGG